MLILLNITFPSFSISLSRDRIPSLKHLSLSIYSGCASLFPRCWTCVARFTSKDGALPTHLFLFWRSYALHREGNKEWLTFDERRKLSYSAVKNREIMIKEYIAEKETERSIPDRASLEEKDARLVAGTERAEEILVRTNLDGIGDDEGRLLFCPLPAKTLASSAIEPIERIDHVRDYWLLTKEKNCCRSRRPRTSFSLICYESIDYRKKKSSPVLLVMAELGSWDDPRAGRRGRDKTRVGERWSQSVRRSSMVQSHRHLSIRNFSRISCEWTREEGEAEKGS